MEIDKAARVFYRLAGDYSLADAENVIAQMSLSLPEIDCLCEILENAFAGKSSLRNDEIFHVLNIAATEQGRTIIM